MILIRPLIRANEAREHNTHDAIATERGVRMPSFFGYMMWAGVVLVPLFLLLTLLPIAPVLKLS